MAATGALLGLPAARLVRGSSVSMMATMATISCTTFLIAASCGASAGIDFKI